jgi:hypothetical protein
MSLVLHGQDFTTRSGVVSVVPWLAKPRRKLEHLASMRCCRADNLHEQEHALLSVVASDTAAEELRLWFDMSNRHSESRGWKNKRLAEQNGSLGVVTKWNDDGEKL